MSEQTRLNPETGTPYTDVYSPKRFAALNVFSQPPKGSYVDIKAWEGLQNGEVAAKEHELFINRVVQGLFVAFLSAAALSLVPAGLAFSGVIGVGSDWRSFVELGSVLAGGFFTMCAAPLTKKALGPVTETMGTAIRSFSFKLLPDTDGQPASVEAQRKVVPADSGLTL